MGDVNLDGGVNEPESVIGDAVADKPKEKPAETPAVNPPETTGTIGPTTDPASVDAVQNAAQAATKPEEDQFEEYDLELADNSPLSQEDLDAIVKHAEQYGLSKEETQALIKSKEDLYARGKSDFENKFNVENNRNREELLKMPEFQGEKMQESFASIGGAVAAFGDAELINFLKGPAGNNPALARFMLKIGNSMKSDTFNGKGKVPNSTEEKPDVLKTMYPDFYK